MLLLAALCVPIGISIQLSWLEFRCVGEPFLGSTKATCRDNLLRMILGGPLFFLCALVLLAWIKNQPTPVRTSRLLLPIFFLLPICTLPFIHSEPTHNAVLLTIVCVFGIVFSYVAKGKILEILKIFFFKPEFSLILTKTPNGEHLLFAGKLQNSEREWVYKSIQDILMAISFDSQNVEIDVQGLCNLSSEFSFIFHLIEAHSQLRKYKVSLVCSKQQVKLIQGMWQFQSEITP